MIRRGATPRTGRQLDAVLADAGLGGRGGAGYPTVRKLQAARQHRATLIVNACDGELGQRKDAYVIEHHLEEVLDAASMISRRFVVATHRGSATEVLLLQAGVPLLAVPDRYVSSEESALVAFAQGRPARPVTKVRPTAYGLTDSGGRRLAPTLVLNAETMLRISQIAALGASWFRSWGTADEPGPRLVTVGGAVRRPGVYEGATGMPIGEILAAAGIDDVLAVNVGGLGGGWITGRTAAHLPWSTPALRPHGCAVGSGVLHVLDGRSCPVEHVLRTVEYAAGESAGQCGPCMFGVPAVARGLRALAAGEADDPDALRLPHRVTLLPGRGACHFPDGVATYVGTALQVFGEHLREHARHGCRDCGKAAGHAAAG